MVDVKKRSDVFADLGGGRNSWKIKNNTLWVTFVLKAISKKYSALKICGSKH